MFGDPHALHRFDRETQIDLRAYWQIQRATDQPARPASVIKPSDLRMISGSPATLGDLAQMWLLAHPPPKAQATSPSSLRSAWKRRGVDDRALDFWLQ